MKISFIIQILFLIILYHVMFNAAAHGQTNDLSKGPVGELNNKLSQSTLDSYVSPKSLMASVFGEVNNNNSTTGDTKENSTQYEKNLIGDSSTILLSNQILPPKDYVHIYDSLPYKITSGHLTAKLSCDTKSKPTLKIYTGKIPVLRQSSLHVLKEMSKPGYMCLYYLDIPPKDGAEQALNRNSTNIVTDVVLYNPTNVKQILLNTSSIVIGLSTISPEENNQTQNTTTQQ
ncbi:MAG TPA: hypothetical protein VH796_12655 [Nitrososphaeraceae archaeon]